MGPAPGKQVGGDVGAIGLSENDTVFEIGNGQSNNSRVPRKCEPFAL